MYTQRQFPFYRGVLWTWQILPVVGGWATLLTAAHIYLELEWLRLPALPVGVLGTAVSFYLGFKGSAAYDRLWEARKIWGGIVNTSRTWGAFVVSLVSDVHLEGRPAEPPLPEVHRELILRHVAWLDALRIQLRRAKPWEHRTPHDDTFRELFGTNDMSDARLERLLAARLAQPEVARLMGQKNRATQLVRAQAERLTELYAAGRIEDFRHMQMVAILEELYTLQGRCERIKNFPLPRQYSSANHWFVKIFIMLLPLAMLNSFHGEGLPEAYAWATVPATMVVSWVFYMWDRVLDFTENPFEGLINDVPIDALARTIEIDLLEMLGDTELPPPAQAIQGSVLM